MRLQLQLRSYWQLVGAAKGGCHFSLGSEATVRLLTLLRLASHASHPCGKHQVWKGSLWSTVVCKGFMRGDNEKDLKDSTVEMSSDTHLTLTSESL